VSGDWNREFTPTPFEARANSITFSLEKIMKYEHLKTEFRRHEAMAAMDEGTAVNVPVGAWTAGTATAAKTGPQPRETETRAKTLLLVSDDAGLGIRLLRTADLAGLAFVQVIDADVAFWLVSQESPAVVFLDLDMPGMAGWEIAEGLLDNESCPSLILLTSCTSHMDLNTAIDAGAIADKSAAPEQLLPKADWVLAEADSERTDRKARQRLLIRWLKPYAASVPVVQGYRHWGINE